MYEHDSELQDLLSVAERHSISNLYLFGVLKCEAIISVAHMSFIKLYQSPL